MTIQARAEQWLDESKEPTAHHGELVVTAQDVIRDLLTELTRLQQPIPLWQPIETAPQKATVIVMYLSAAGLGMCWIRDAHRESHGWFTKNGQALPGKPTHWMPIPGEVQQPIPQPSGDVKALIAKWRASSRDLAPYATAGTFHEGAYSTFATCADELEALTPQPSGDVARVIQEIAALRMAQRLRADASGEHRMAPEAMYYLADLLDQLATLSSSGDPAAVPSPPAEEAPIRDGMTPVPSLPSLPPRETEQEHVTRVGDSQYGERSGTASSNQLFRA